MQKTAGAAFGGCATRCGARWFGLSETLVGREIFGEVFLKVLAGFRPYEAVEVELLDILSIFRSSSVMMRLRRSRHGTSSHLPR